MRLRFHSKRLYTDLEWGFREKEPEVVESDEPDGPADYIPPPMREDPRQRIGFHTTGGYGGSGFTTGDI